ncbi:MAG: helix-turn-helix transcriptional regulator [Bacteriovoracaceae bacterium]|nr:helix-turn-helix transcriptional regulator [Bacteriovoracaceae bacterium]
MRCFKNIAQLIRTRRMNHPKGYSQSELSHLLGYKNGQFISNVERALCNIPLKMLKRVSEVLDIPSEELKNAILRDQEETLNNYLYNQKASKKDKDVSSTATDLAKSALAAELSATGTDGI